MNSDSVPELDWVHLPPGVEPESLWDCLHDSYLIRSRSNLWERTVTLDFRSYHLQEHFELPEDWEFQFRFEQVAAVRVFTYQTPKHPEREAIEVSGRALTHEEDYRLSVEAHERDRLETASWSSFELALVDEDTSFDVLNAEYVQREDGALTLRLGGMLHGSNWHQLVIRAGNLTVLRSDRESFSLEELLTMGETYLEDFSRRRPEP